ncbi:hypothetical protein [Halomonas heilongjiangensis]|uniref:hypothetical protein n=1 Tax=Halomonas heilongjiangensis TaxID=1387883 RepID=UPI0011AF81A6|nr:hypothetical protein [Halomonas heilongjiangensis]
MFIHKEGKKSFEGDMEFRHLSGVSSNILDLKEAIDSEAVRNHSSNIKRYKGWILFWASGVFSFNLMLYPGYGSHLPGFISQALFWVGNALLGMLLFDAANKYSMSKQGIGYQRGIRKALINIRYLIKKKKQL